MGRFSIFDRSYSPALIKPQDQVYSDEPTRNFYKQETSSTLTPLATVGGLLAAGSFQRKGKPLWNTYVNAMRWIEGYSPGGILSTFQLSTMGSQFADYGKLEILPEQLKSSTSYRRLLADVIGAPGAEARLLQEGFLVEGGQGFWGKTRELALKHAGIWTTPGGTRSNIGSAYAYSLGSGSDIARNLEMPLSSYLGLDEVSQRTGLPRIPQLQGMPAQVIGGQTQKQHIFRQVSAVGTEFVSRFNRLLAAPAGMQPFETGFKWLQKGASKLGVNFALDVAEGPGLKMFGALAKKYGLGLGAVALGYQSADYATRHLAPLDSTLLDEGLTVGAATLWTRGQMGLSNVAELTGGHSLRERQEEIAPGSTRMTRLLGFPLTTGFLAGVGAYGVEVSTMARFRGADPELSVQAAKIMAREHMGTFRGDTLFSKAGRLLTEQTGIYSDNTMLGKMLQKVSTPDKEGKLVFKFLGKVGPIKLATGLGAAFGLSLTVPFWPGALVPDERPDVLARQYAGEEDIGIRRGRWWEFGRSKWEGDYITHFRPHWYARMRGRARERALWNEDELGELSPLEKWFSKEFTYSLEEAHKESRPYPVSGLPFEDIPLVGPLLAGTVGRIIKPPRYYHEDEWRGGGSGGSYLSMPLSYGDRFALELGEQLPGAPRAPWSAAGVVGEQTYRMTEMMGLPGFMMTSIKEGITGTSDLFDQTPQLETARRMYGFERKYWDLELGGLAGMTEAFRRLFPHRRRQIPLYNPIQNEMPEWLPGPGERSRDFRTGDPYVTVPEGELRLPGIGYATRHSELQGVDPEDYPLIHRYKILNDIAPYSDKYKEHLRQIRSKRQSEDWTEYEETLYQEAIGQRKAKMDSRSEFYEYQYLSPSGGISGGYDKWGTEGSSGLISTLNEINAERRGGKGAVASVLGGYWEVIAHNMETPVEFLTPVSPASKLIHMRTPVEAYKATQVYGTGNAFWQSPVRDFLRPTFNVLKAGVGIADVPEHIQKKRSINQYFDMIKYVKYDRLSDLASAAGDTRALAEFESKKEETLFGINPYTHNYTALFRSIPSSERNFISAFMEAPTPEVRSEILNLVPENQRGLLIARWQLSLTQDLETAIKSGRLSSAEHSEALKTLTQVAEAKSNEGFPRTKELNAQFWATREQGENYGDWYRRTQILPYYNLPGPGWIGWNPAVDVDDVKLKLVQNLGENMHDYGMYREQAQKLGAKPFIDEASVEEPIQGLNNPINDIKRLTDMTHRYAGQLSYHASYGTIKNDSVSTNIFHRRDNTAYRYRE